MSRTKSPGFAFVCQQLEADHDAPYAKVREAAEQNGFTIYPIMYGRAKAKLGLVDVAPRKSKRKAAEPQAPRKAATPQAPARNGGAVGSLEAVISAMKAGDAQRQRYRKALERIAAICEEVLAAER